MKKQKRQRTLFDDDHYPNLGIEMPAGYDPFNEVDRKQCQSCDGIGWVVIDGALLKCGYCDATGGLGNVQLPKPSIEPYKRKTKNTSLPIPQKHAQPVTAPQVGRQIIHGNIPSKSNCYKIIILKNKDKTKEHGSLAKTQPLKEYEKTFYIQCGMYRNKMIDGFFELEVDTFFPSMRSDLDNCLKILLDCLQQCNAIKNDNQCVAINARKFVDKENPRVEFTIKPAMP